ncbi:LysR family transcriptional regulator [Neisseria iguanae]|nr:LysR family transcriptional regulator [Neisseria iguanae]
MRIFVEVANQGSFTVAADNLDLSRPMVTRHIAALEEWLNIRLLQRTTRQVTLTDAGERALATCKQILELAEQAEWEADAQNGELRGTVQISSMTAFGSSHLVQAVSAFQQHHPKLQVRMLLSDEPVNIISARIDLAIRATLTPDPSLHARKLAPCRSLLVAAPHYLAKHGIPATPQQLTEHRCLSHDMVNRTLWRLSRDGEHHDLNLNSVLTINETQALMHAVLGGAGIAMLPRYLANESLANGELASLLTDWDLPEYTLYALYPSKDKLSLAVRQLLDFLVGQFNGMDW